MSVSRRGFLALFAGAVAASATSGFALVPAPPAALPAKKLKARHIHQYDITEASGTCFVHRIDVLIENNQYGVDFQSDSATPTARELEPALLVLANHIEHRHGSRFDFDIRSFTLEQVHSGEASRWFGRIGDPA